MLGLWVGLGLALHAPAVRLGARARSPQMLTPYEEWMQKRGMAATAEPQQPQQSQQPQQPQQQSAAQPAVAAEVPMPMAPPPIVAMPTDLIGTVSPARTRRTSQMPPMAAVVDEAADLLPRQAIMGNFVHHNPLERLQGKEFFEALDEVDAKSSYMSPAERLATIKPLDPRVRANKAVATLGANFLDRGLAKWEPPNRERGFLYFFASLENLGSAPWRHHARQAANRIIAIMDRNPNRDSKELALQLIEENLKEVEPDSSLWVSTTRAMLLDHPGWAGMFKRMEEREDERPVKFTDGKSIPIPVSLAEFVAVQSIITMSSVKALALKEGWKPDVQPLSKFLSKVSTRRRGERPRFGMGAEMQSLQNPSGLAYESQNFDVFQALEEQYEKVTMRAINTAPSLSYKPASRIRPNLQFYTCFDDREESFRRHIEGLADDMTDIETFGIAAFFNLPMKYKTDDQRPEETLAVEGVDGAPLNKMTLQQRTRGFLERKKLLAELTLAYERASFSPLGSLAISALLLPFSAHELFLKSLAPQTAVALEDAFSSVVMPKSVTDFDSPFSDAEASSRLAQVFKNIGVTKQNDFARLVMLTGHGARSVNNPLIAAYGRDESGPNARVFARYANNPSVRMMLRQQYGINIPDDTWFVGGYHDTTSDTVELYDVERVPATHERDLARARDVIDRARAQNALERCQKFFLADDVQTPEQALKHVRLRARDTAEVRPELAHSTNGAVIVGRRELTKGKFLDRRAFLPSYDPFEDDERGTNLESVLTPALLVGSSISLEYLFSTVNGGAGTKAPMNVVGNFGLQQGTAGDLLVGLATQMTELHSPQRAMYVIDAPVARVEAVLQRNKKLEDIVRNKWVKFFVRDPTTQQMYKEDNGRYFPVDAMEDSLTPLPDTVPFTKHQEYGKMVKKEEDDYTKAAYALIAASALLPFVPEGIEGFDLMLLPAILDSVDPIQVITTTSAALFGASTVAFSRRFLHGEFMYGRMQMTSAAMVLGFNMVATAPTLQAAALGWTLIGYCSTFLIGGFNDRPTARDNAAYAFLIYQLSDAALLSAIAFGPQNDVTNPELAALGLVLAATMKASQFPVSGLFLRSMEGATPTSALGYAALSAHVPVVLLAQTMPMWFEYDWARLLLAAIGGITAVQSTIIANVRADRRGSIASSTSATLGAILIVLAAGFDETALLLSLGHAAFRMNQILRSPGSIQENNEWAATLGAAKTSSQPVVDVFWKAGWSLNRLNSDFFRLPDTFYEIDLKKPLKFYNAKGAQLTLTAFFLATIGAFHLPQVNEKMAELLQTEPLVAAFLIAGNVIGSTALIRFLFGNVLDFGRFTSDRNKA